MSYEIGIEYSIKGWYTNILESIDNERIKQFEYGKSYFTFTPRNESDLDFMLDFESGNEYNNNEVPKEFDNDSSTGKGIDYEYNNNIIDYDKLLDILSIDDVDDADFEYIESIFVSHDNEWEIDY